MKIVLLTGYSGAGKSSALRFIEDGGYYCVDNLPAKLLSDFVAIAKESDIEKVAVVIDARGREFLNGLEEQLLELERKHSLLIVFCEANFESITKRFQEHRLRHPLALRGTIQSGYEIEKKLLVGLRQKAHLVLDTSHMSVHSLKTLVHKHILGSKGEHFEINLMSFGYKYGVPQEADIVIDVRPLINPFFEAALKRKSGKSAQVNAYMFADAGTGTFLKKTAEYLDFVVKKYRDKNKPFVTVGFGCTGGRHRSVFMAEEMKKILQGRYKKVKVLHRDIKLD